MPDHPVLLGPRSRVAGLPEGGVRTPTQRALPDLGVSGVRHRKCRDGKWALGRVGAGCVRAGGTGVMKRSSSG